MFSLLKHWPYMVSEQMQLQTFCVFFFEAEKITTISNSEQVWHLVIFFRPFQESVSILINSRTSKCLKNNKWNSRVFKVDGENVVQSFIICAKRKFFCTNCYIFYKNVSIWICLGHIQSQAPNSFKHIWANKVLQWSFSTFWQKYPKMVVPPKKNI